MEICPSPSLVSIVYKVVFCFYSNSKTVRESTMVSLVDQKRLAVATSPTRRGLNGGALYLLCFSYSTFCNALLSPSAMSFELDRYVDVGQVSVNW